MTAVDVAQESRRIVVITEKQCGEGAVRCVVAKKAVYLLQHALRLFQREGELTAEISLQIGHQKGGGNSLPGDVGDDETETIGAEAEEVVVIPAHGTSGDAGSGIFERFELRHGLRKESGMHLRGDGQFLGGAAFGFEFFRGDAALGFDGVGNFVEAD